MLTVAMLLVLAGERPLVSVTAAPAQERAVVLLSSELERLGFRVGRLMPSDEVSRSGQLQQARAAGAVALLRLVPAGAAVEVWLTDRVTGKTVIREYALEGSPRSDDAVALGAVELLRASLLELSTPASTKPETPAPEEARQLSASVVAPPRVSVFVGGAGLLVGGGAGPSLGLDASADIRVTEAFGGQFNVRLAGLFGLTSSRVSSGSDVATLTSTSAGVLVGWSRPLFAALSLDAAVGGAAMLLAARGASLVVTRNVDATAWTGGLWAVASVTYWFVPGVGARLQVGALGAVLPVEVRFAGDTVARWGLPLMSGAVGLVVAR